MPIDSDFPKNHKVVGKHSTADGDYFHFVWGPGRKDAESSTNKEVQDAYKARGEEYVPLGIHGTFVAVDWDFLVFQMEHASKHVQFRYINGIGPNKTFLL